MKLREKKKLNARSIPRENNSTEMTSFCDVVNRTEHLQAQIDCNKVGNYAWRMYDDICSSSQQSKMGDRSVTPSVTTKNPPIIKSVLQGPCNDRDGRRVATAMQLRKAPTQFEIYKGGDYSCIQTTD